jgi:hypothetical protein
MQAIGHDNFAQVLGMPADVSRSCRVVAEVRCQLRKESQERAAAAREATRKARETELAEQSAVKLAQEEERAEAATLAASHAMLAQQQGELAAAQQQLVEQQLVAEQQRRLMLQQQTQQTLHGQSQPPPASSPGLFPTGAVSQTHGSQTPVAAASYGGAVVSVPQGLGGGTAALQQTRMLTVAQDTAEAKTREMATFLVS